LSRFWFLHNIRASANVYKRGGVGRVRGALTIPGSGRCGSPLACAGPLLALRQDTMSWPQRHRHPRENPHLRSGDSRSRLRALRVSVVTICAKRTQFPARSGSPRFRGRGPIMQNEPNLESNRAKRTQFGPAGGGRRRKLCKTKPNLGRRGYMGKGTRRVGRGSAGEGNVQNEANLGARDPGLRIGDCGLRIERPRPWAGAGGKMRKTNPIWATGGRSRAGRPTYQETPYGVTTNGAGACKTKPVSSIRLVSRGESCRTNPIS
jgi:hypothetical protein